MTPEEFPTVSAVLVSRNQAEPLRRTLAALLPPGAPWLPEVVVVDAGSRDGSADLDAEFPSVRLVKMPRNFGKTRARNIGIRTATGELILLLQPGVLLSPDAVQSLVTALLSDPHAGAAAPRLRNSQNEPIPQTYPLPDAETLARHSLSGAPLPADATAPRAEAVSDQVLLLRKSFIGGMNFLDEKSFGENWAELDLFRQLKNAGRDILILDSVPATAPEPAPDDPSLRSLLTCDRIAASGAYLRKRHGGMAEISFKIKMIGKAFGAPGGLSLLAGIFSGTKIDGEQD